MKGVVLWKLCGKNFKGGLDSFKVVKKRWNNREKCIDN